MSMAGAKLWTPAEEARLQLWAVTRRRRCCIDFARATGRSERSVRMKLHRLETNPVTRPPDCVVAANTDAAAPRVPTARGPGDTSDS
jgi:hypothetical protein